MVAQRHNWEAPIEWRPWRANGQYENIRHYCLFHNLGKNGFKAAAEFHVFWHMLKEIPSGHCEPNSEGRFPFLFHDLRTMIDGRRFRVFASLVDVKGVYLGGGFYEDEHDLARITETARIRALKWVGLCQVDRGEPWDPPMNLDEYWCRAVGHFSAVNLGPLSERIT